LSLTLVPYSPGAEPTASAAEPEPESVPEPEPVPDPTPATRHDGWTPERVATFLETLAATGLVTDSARAAGMHRDSAYDLRARDRVFAAAWRAAQVKARRLLADGLLERSITGTVEQYFRDGQLVGERRHYESWLGLAVLKRLDRLADEDRADDTLAGRIARDWQAAIEALRTGGTGAVEEPALSLSQEPALSLSKGDKPDKPDTPHPPPGYDPWDNIWHDEERGWLTHFPPPADFTGYESREWNGWDLYTRTCTPEEVTLLETHAEAIEGQIQADLAAEAQAERDNFFTLLRAECSEADAKHRLSSTKSRAEPASGSPEAIPTDVTQGAESNPQDCESERSDGQELEAPRDNGC